MTQRTTELLIDCVGAIVRDAAGRFLLVRRANPPAQGLWSIPGGRVEAGESAHDAVVRELAEETGLQGTIRREVGTVERAAPGGGTYVIRDFLVEVDGAEAPVAGDDAADAAWFTPADLDTLETSPGLVDALSGWGLLARGIPIIDLGLLRGPEPAEETARLRAALHETGFLYVTGHGVAPSIVDGVFAAARDFFALPLDDRLAIDEVNSPHFRGYTQLGNELTQGRADQRDQLDVGPEREALELGPDDPAYLRMTGPNQWPAALPSLRPAVLAWYDEARRVSIELLQCIAVALGQPADWFDPWFDEQTHDHLKVIRYPGSLVRSGDQGVGAHKDYGWLALLVQDDLGGLQVQALDGTWLDATPVPGTFVVNIGEMLEVATRGYLRATVHRVVSPPTTQDRYSIPFFLGPRLDATVPAIPLPDDLAAQARGIEDDPSNPLLSEYGANALKGWLRAHPRVAERWWSDVRAESQTQAGEGP
jgi:isopenicillin N synthase-like dioxygenase/ADP-ribose pyrophosphatase YjhB (NUDIX family)